MKDHARLAEEFAQDLCVRPRAPGDLDSVARQVAYLGVEGLHLRRLAAMGNMLSLAAELQAASDAALREAPAHLQQVLRATSPSGAHPALLQDLLQEFRWHDLDFVQDLLRGFPLVGNVPVDTHAPEAPVRGATLTSRQLLAHAPTLAPYLLARHARASGGPEAHQVDCSIFQQTLEEIALGRMAPLSPPDPQRLTRRFGVVQRSARRAP